MEYESSILKRLIDTYGVVGNPRYISEIIKEFIVQGKERFPNLFTYQADWLAHIDEFGLNPSYTVSYTGQSIYAPNTLEKPIKSASLKGSTKYRDIDTGEILEAFEEGRNLELVTVKMPVLKTVGKNLFNESEKIEGYFKANSTKEELETNIKNLWTTPWIKAKPNTSYTIQGGNRNRWQMKSHNNVITFIENKTITTLTDTEYIRCYYCNEEYIASNVQLEESSSTTSYEPYKSNILTVNEDVTLRSNGGVCDELDLLTGKLTQRIGEDGEVLSQEVVKTVGLNIQDQNGQNIKQLISFNGGTHFNTGSAEGTPLPVVSVSVETDLEETLRVCSLEGNTL